MNESRRTRLRIKEWYEPATDRGYLSLEWRSLAGVVERCFTFRLDDPYLTRKVLDFVAFYQEWEA